MAYFLFRLKVGAVCVTYIMAGQTPFVQVPTSVILNLTFQHMQKLVGKSDSVSVFHFLTADASKD